MESAFSMNHIPLDQRVSRIETAKWAYIWFKASFFRDKSIIDKFNFIILCRRSVASQLWPKLYWPEGEACGMTSKTILFVGLITDEWVSCGKTTLEQYQFYYMHLLGLLVCSGCIKQRMIAPLTWLPECYQSSDGVEPRSDFPKVPWNVAHRSYLMYHKICNLRLADCGVSLYVSFPKLPLIRCH